MRGGDEAGGLLAPNFWRHVEGGIKRKGGRAIALRGYRGTLGVWAVDEAREEGAGDLS